MKNEKLKKDEKADKDWVGKPIFPRVYISGPITGIEGYKQIFDKADLYLSLKGYKTVNPAQLDNVISEGEYEEYMDICLRLIDMCQFVILLPGWEKSAGANREYGYALGKGKTVISLDDIEIIHGDKKRE